MDVIIMDISGIPGESKLAGFEKKIELLAFAHGMALQINRDRDRTHDDPQHQEFSVTKRLDSTSPLLNLACCTGKDLGTVKITLARKEQAGLTVVMVYELSHVMISTVSVGGSTSEVETPIESLALNYKQIRWVFTPASGAGNAVQSGWDLENNKPL
jgi:type VI secretion system secreted protein Hcp